MLFYDRETEWALLMRAALDGDEAAYRRLLQSLVHPLRLLIGRGLARVRLGTGDVEDIVQETLLAIHLKADTWRRGSPITPWIAAIARHKLVDTLRRRHLAIEISIDDLVEGLAAPPDPVTDVTATELQSLLDALSDRQRAIVRSISIDGETIATTATNLKISEGAVRVGLHRGLKSLAARARKSIP